MCKQRPATDRIEDTDATSETTTSTEETLEEWYEQREFDSMFFPLSMFLGGHTDGGATSSDSGADSRAFPRRGYLGQKNCWDEAEWADVKVRGQTYLQSRRKEHSQSPMLELVDVDLFAPKHEVVAVSSSAPPGFSGLARARNRGDTRFLFIINFRMGGTQLAVTWALPEGGEWRTEPAGRLLDRFLGTGMGDAERSERLKLLPLVIEGPLMLRSALPPRPAIVGRQCPTTYFRGDRCLEASVDCSSATFGRKFMRMCRGGGCVMSLFAIIEGQAQDELPERLVGGALVNVDIDSAAAC